MRPFFLTLSILFSQYSYGNTCDPIRLDQTTLKDVKPYDQKLMGICYAITSTQAVDAWRASRQSSRQPSSPLHTAILYTDGTKRQLIDEFALQLERMEEVSKVSGDTEQFDDIEFQKKSIERLRDMGYDLGDTVHALKEVIKNGTCDAKSVDAVVSQASQEKLNSSIKAYAQAEEVKSNLKEIKDENCDFKVNNFQDNIQDIMTVVSEESKIHINEMRQIVHVACKGNLQQIIPKPGVRAIQFEQMPEKKRIDSIHQVLNQETPQPVIVDICADINEDPGFRDQIDYPEMQKMCMKSLDHSMLVVGRRKSANGKCQFLVRNSYGEKCKKEYVWECEKGQLWIDEDKLANSTGRMTYLD